MFDQKERQFLTGTPRRPLARLLKAKYNSKDEIFSIVLCFKELQVWNRTT